MENGIGLFTSETLARECGELKSLTAKLSLAGVAVDSPERILELACVLNGAKEGPTKVIIRKDMGVLSNLIIKSLDKKENVLLAGSRGAGKSLQGTVVAIELALRGDLVVYQHKGEKLLLIGDRPKESAMKILAEVCAVEGYDLQAILPGKAWVFGHSASDKDFFSRLSKEALMFVQDIGDDPNATIIVDGLSRRLVVSSPNSEKLKPLRSGRSWTHFYMPLWSLEELQLARKVCYPDVVDEATVTSRFNTMSGIPRYVIEALPGTSEKAQKAQIENLNLAGLGGILKTTDFVLLPMQAPKTASSHADVNTGSDLIFKFVPSADYRDFRVQFVSDDVARAVAERFVGEKIEDLRVFLTSTQDIGDLATFRGYVHESLAHRFVRAGLKDVPLYLLEDSAKPSLTPRTVTLPTLHETLFLSLDDMTTLAIDQYCRPRSRNFKSVDSFAVMHANLFDPKAGPHAYALVGFQMTVSPEHAVNGSGLKRVLEKVQAIVQLPAEAMLPPPAPSKKATRAAASAPPPQPLKPKLPLYLVFVVDSAVMHKKQTLVKDAGDTMVLDGFVKAQFMVVPSNGFDELVSLTKNWE